MDEIKVYSYRNPPPSVGIDFPEPTLTQEHFKDECDINFMLARHGVLDPQPGSFYCNFDTARDLRESLEYLREAEDSFLSLPASVREKFANDPANLLDFISRPENVSRFGEFGLTSAMVEDRNSSPLDVTVTTDTSSLKPSVKQEPAQ